MSELVEKRINDIAPTIQAKAIEHGYNYPSAIIGQALQEASGTYGGGMWSELATKAHNYFGMTAGAGWQGKTYKIGKVTYRAYDTREEGIEDYFKFISTSRYSNLKNVTSSSDYLNAIQRDGWNGNPLYGQTIYNNFVKPYSLESKYDSSKPTTDKTKATRKRKKMPIWMMVKRYY